MAITDEPVRYARTACLPCRRSKRRCDRKIPSCDLCNRKEAECSYPSRRDGNQALSEAQDPANRIFDTTSLDGLARVYEREVDNGSQSLVQSPFGESDANAIYFIAPQIFQQARLDLPRLNLGSAIDISSFIGDASSIRNTAVTFFTTVHRWLPVVSKQGFFAYLFNPLAQRQTALSLLALCMKLCCTLPSDEDEGGGTKTTLYRITKRLWQEAEGAGILSIHVLQAGVLVALYELSHAIYPAAYLTVGACARYGLALEIDKACLAVIGDGDGPRSWNEVEEKRRVWWAILMFDRFLSLSNPTRALSTEDPTFDTYLPVDDAAWDNWEAKPRDAVRISNAFTLKLGSFARLAQATYLLSQALRSVLPTVAEGDMTRHDQTAQLRRTLLALVHATDREAIVRRLEFCAQSALSLSAILLLQEHQLKGLDTNANDKHKVPWFDTLWYETRTALDRLSGAAVSYLANCPQEPDAADNVPIFLIHVMYQVACIFLRFIERAPDRETSEKVEILRQLLGRINLRWRLAGIYLRILEAREVMIASEIINSDTGFFLTRPGLSNSSPQMDL